MRCALLWLMLASCGPSVKLSALEKDVFTPSCAFVTCHKAGAPVQGLDLEGHGLYGRLVNVDSTAPGKKYVVPGSPEKSFIIEKLTNPMPSQGVQMPPGAPLEKVDLEKIKGWISAGALDD